MKSEAAGNPRPIGAVIYMQGKNLKMCLRSTDKYGTDTSAIAKVNDLEDAASVYGTLSKVIDCDVKTDTVQAAESLTRKLRRVRQCLDLIRELFQTFFSTELYRAYQRLYASTHDKGIGPHRTRFRRGENYAAANHFYQPPFPAMHIFYLPNMTISEDRRRRAFGSITSSKGESQERKVQNKCCKDEFQGEHKIIGRE